MVILDSLALIKITKSPYHMFLVVIILEGLALIKITKSPYHISLLPEHF